MRGIVILRLLVILGTYTGVPWTDLRPDTPLGSIIDELDFEDLLMEIEEVCEVEIPMRVDEQLADKLMENCEKDCPGESISLEEIDEMREDLTKEEKAVLKLFRRSRFRKSKDGVTTVMDFVRVLSKYV